MTLASSDRQQPSDSLTLEQSTWKKNSGIGQFWTWKRFQVHYKIHYVRAGAVTPQRPPLLLIHGFGASTDHWKKNIAVLSQDFEVYALDLLGFGRSEKAIAPYSGQFWSEQVHAFVQEIIGRPAIIAGNSIGGYTTLCTAAYFPESVAGVALLNCAGPFSGERDPKKPTNPLQQTLQYLRQDLFKQSWVHLLVFLNMRRRSAIRKTLRRVYSNASAITDELVEDIYRPACEKGAFAAFSAMFSSPPGESIDMLLAKMDCPLLQLWGVKDPWGYSETRRQKFLQHYEQQQEAFIQAGHCPHDDAPEWVNTALRDWALQLDVDSGKET